MFGFFFCRFGVFLLLFLQKKKEREREAQKAVFYVLMLFSLFSPISSRNPGNQERASPFSPCIAVHFVCSLAHSLEPPMWAMPLYGLFALVLYLLHIRLGLRTFGKFGLAETRATSHFTQQFLFAMAWAPPPVSKVNLHDSGHELQSCRAFPAHVSSCLAMLICIQPTWLQNLLAWHQCSHRKHNCHIVSGNNTS